MSVATTGQEAAALRRDWSTIRRHQGLRSLDADPDFFLAISETLSEDVQPYVVTFWQEDGPTTLVVGRVSKQRIPYRIGYFRIRSPELNCLEVVYEGLINCGTLESRELVLAHFASLLSERAVDLIRIAHLNVRHEIGQQLRHQIAPRRMTCHEEVHLFRELRDRNSGKPLLHNSSKSRSTFRRKERRLVNETGGVILESFRSIEETVRFIELADLITSRSYQARLGVGVRNTLSWRSKVEALARMGSLRGYVLRADKEPLAYVLGAVVSQQFTLMATGFSPSHRHLSPGLVLINRVFEALLAEGVERVDLGFGDAEYKRLHASEVESEWTISLYGAGWRPSLSCALEKTIVTTSRLLRWVIAVLRCEDWLRRKWRRQLERG